MLPLPINATQFSFTIKKLVGKWEMKVILIIFIALGRDELKKVKYLVPFFASVSSYQGTDKENYMPALPWRSNQINLDYK